MAVNTMKSGSSTLAAALRRAADDYVDSVYIVNDRLEIVYTNSGWGSFARDNGGGDILSEGSTGRNVLDCCVEPRLRSFYADLYRDCLESPRANTPIQHEYECSSPTTYRRFRMSLFSIDNPRSIMVLHAKVLEAPIETQGRELASRAERAEIEARGIITQCCHCRMVRSVRSSSRWVWAAEWVSRCSDRVSHTFCSICLEYYYPAEA